MQQVIALLFILLIYFLFLFASDDGRIIKFVDLLDNKNLIQTSQWKVCNEAIEEIQIKRVCFICTFVFYLLIIIMLFKGSIRLYYHKRRSLSDSTCAMQSL